MILMSRCCGPDHSAEVAGLAAWVNLAPFRKIIQSVDVQEHRRNCNVKRGGADIHCSRDAGLRLSLDGLLVALRLFKLVTVLVDLIFHQESTSC